MKLLVVPSLILIYPYYYFVNKRGLLNFFFRTIIKFLNLKPSLLQKPIPSCELMYYGRLFSILNKKQLKVLGEIHPVYFENKNLEKYKKIYEIDKYAQTLGYKKPAFINKKQYLSNKFKFDALLISWNSFYKFFDVVKDFKKKGKIVAIFEYADDDDVIFNSKKNIFRNIPEKYFDLYFKQDLPLTNKHPKAYPIAPVPAKDFVKPYKKTKSQYDFSFFGKIQKRTSDDRKLLISLIQNNFNNVFFRTREDYSSGVMSRPEMENILNQTKINLSPSGISWNSFRHADLARYNRPIIISSPAIKLSGKNFSNDVNCVMYQRVKNKKGNQFIIKDSKKFIEKLKKILNDEKKLSKLTRNYIAMVKKYHTETARAKQIYNVILNAFQKKSKYSEKS